jgi:hypothetical protein
MRVFESRVLRRIFGPMKDEVKREWRKLHNEELNDPYSSPKIFRVIKSRRMRLAEHVARIGERKGLHRILVGKTERKRPLRRSTYRCEYGIKTSSVSEMEGSLTGLIWLRIRGGDGHF